MGFIWNENINFSVVVIRKRFRERLSNTTECMQISVIGFKVLLNKIRNVCEIQWFDEKEQLQWNKQFFKQIIGLDVLSIVFYCIYCVWEIAWSNMSAYFHTFLQEEIRIRVQHFNTITKIINSFFKFYYISAPGSTAVRT